MAQAYTYLGAGSPKQVLHFASERLYEIEKAMVLMEAERDMWKGIIASISPCKECGGFGELRVFDDGETQARRVTCEKCKGEGR